MCGHVNGSDDQFERLIAALRAAALDCPCCGHAFRWMGNLSPDGRVWTCFAVCSGLDHGFYFWGSRWAEPEIDALRYVAAITAAITNQRAGADGPVKYLTDGVEMQAQLIPFDVSAALEGIA